jgi:hypothetical protein
VKRTALLTPIWKSQHKAYDSGRMIDTYGKKLDKNVKTNLDE